jgi:hypothetical protein
MFCEFVGRGRQICCSESFLNLFLKYFLTINNYFFFCSLSPFTTPGLSGILRSACFFPFFFLIGAVGFRRFLPWKKILPLRWDSNPLAPGPWPRSTVSDSHAATELPKLVLFLTYIKIGFLVLRSEQSEVRCYLYGYCCVLCRYASR